MNKKITINCEPVESIEWLKRNIFIVISDALSTPPHIGMLFNGKYSSLTSKGFEHNVRIDVLLKKMSALNSTCIFLRLVEHPVFSINYLSELFHAMLLQIGKAQADSNATCLSPVKQLLKEGYFFDSEQHQFIYQLVPSLIKQQLIDKAYSFPFNTTKNNVQLYEFPVYEMKDIFNRIQNHNTLT